MEIYTLNPVTGEFVGQSMADPDPLEPGNWLIPAHAVTVAPPDEKQGKARVWDGSAWQQVEDHSGETWWDSNGDPVEIEDLGDPADQGLTDVEPPAPPPSRSDVNAEAARRTKAGFVFQGVHFQFDDLAKARITGAAALAHQALTIGGKQPTDTKWHNDGGADDPEFAWIATDNSLVVMNAATVLSFGAKAANWESVHVFAAKALKDADPIPTNYEMHPIWP